MRVVVAAAAASAAAIEVHNADAPDIHMHLKLFGGGTPPAPPGPAPAPAPAPPPAPKKPYPMQWPIQFFLPCHVIIDDRRLREKCFEDLEAAENRNARTEWLREHADVIGIFSWRNPGERKSILFRWEY